MPKIDEEQEKVHWNFDRWLMSNLIGWFKWEVFL